MITTIILIYTIFSTSPRVFDNPQVLNNPRGLGQPAGSRVGLQSTPIRPARVRVGQNANSTRPATQSNPNRAGQPDLCRSLVFTKILFFLLFKK